MPIRLNLKRTHRYDVSSKGLFVVPIYTLNQLALEYTVSANTTGRDALEFVAQRLEIDDVSYFGFRYESWGGEYRWIFLNKPIKKQLDKHARQHTLVFGVMFFIENPQVIPRDVVRRQFFFQLRHEVASGTLVLTPKQAIKLCAYSLQADYGDFVDCQTTIERWRERPPISESCLRGAADLETVEHGEDILWGYRHLQGVTQVNAQWYFIDEVRRRDSYGVQLFYGGMKKNVLSELGVSRNGITISDIIDSKTSQQHHVLTLRWEEIKDLAYSKKTFSIQRLRKSKPINFSMNDKDNARYLWQYCIQIHGFYINYWTRLRTSPPQPTVHVPEPPDIIRGMSSVGLNQRANSSRSHTSDGSAGDSQPSLTGHRSFGESSPLSHVQHTTTASSSAYTSASSHGNLHSNHHLPTPAAAAATLQQKHSTSRGGSVDPDYLHTSSQLQLLHQVVNPASPNGTSARSPQHSPFLALQPPPPPLPPYRLAPDYDTAMRDPSSSATASSLIVTATASSSPLYDNLVMLSRATPTRETMPHSYHHYHQQHQHHPPGSPAVGLAPPLLHQPPAPPEVTVEGKRVSTGSTTGAAGGAGSTADQMARLLSNPDIHQLLALTNIQETELTHRLLAEYRQTLRQQQFIHTNSVSTPNLAARDIFEAAATLERTHNPTRIAAANQRATRAAPGSLLADQPPMTNHSAAGSTGGGFQFQSNGASGFVGGAGASGSSLLRGDGTGGRRRRARDRASGASSSADSNATFRVKCESLLLPGDEAGDGGGESMQDEHSCTSQASLGGRRGALPVSRSEQGPRWGLCPGSPSGPADFPFSGGGSSQHASASVGDDEDDDDEGSLHEYVLQQPEERPSHYTATHLSVLLARQKHHYLPHNPHQQHLSSPGNRFVKITPPPSTPVPTRLPSPSTRPTGGGGGKRLSLTHQTGGPVCMPTEEAANSGIGTGQRRGLTSLENTSLSLLELLKRPRPSTCPVSRDEKRIELELVLSEPGLLMSQFQSLPTRSPTATCYVAASPENRARNRSELVLPYDQARVKLEPTTENASGYINASHVKVDLERGGHRLQLWLITTQIPLPTTVADFWAMVWQCQVGVMALLAGERSAMPLYIPTEEIPVLHLRDMTVRFQWKKPCGRYIQTCVEIEHKTRGRCRPVYHFRYTDWTENQVPTSVADFTEYLDDLTALNRHLTSQEHAPGSPSGSFNHPPTSHHHHYQHQGSGEAGRPLLLHCDTGAGGSGLSALYLVMRAVLEHNLAHSNLRVSDVLTSLRTSSCQGLVQNLDQYVFVHAALLHYLRRTRLI